jgi:homoserine O-acetyltransferase
LSGYHVVVVAMFGNGESSSPSNTDGFPQPLYQDCINAYYELFTKHLNIHELEAVIGYGMGGQQAYYWACMRPCFVKNAVVICGSAQTSSFNYALLSGTASALMQSASYARGKAIQQGVEPEGLHAYGQLTCPWATSSAWFKNETFRTVLGFETLQDYMDEYQSSFSRWNAADLLGLVKMWQLGDVGALREDNDCAKALEQVEARVLVIASGTDYYFT